MKKIIGKDKIKKRKIKIRRKYKIVKYSKYFEKIKKRKNNLIRLFRYFILLIKFLFLIIILYIIYYKIILFYKKNKFCIDCSNNLDNINQKCWECSVKILFKGLKIVSKENTLNEIIKHKKSIARFGDGEYVIIHGDGIYFQKYDKNLSRRLYEIINKRNKNRNLLVGIYLPYKKEELALLKKNTINYWNGYISSNKFKILKILNKKKNYYSSSISRFYTDCKSKATIPNYIKTFKTLWDKRDIIIVEGEESKSGFGNDLFNNTKSIKRIICPSKHAYSVYDKILNAVLKFSKDNLILISLGPTAPVLAYDLTKLGYQAIDLGSVGIQYELYLRNSPLMFIKVDDVIDLNYPNQIIEKIVY